MEYETVKYTVADRKAIITFNRPQVHNALSYKMIEEVVEALKQAEKSTEVRAIILKGEGKSFCSGDDLFSMRKEKQEAFNPDVPMEVVKGWMMSKGYEQIVLAIREVPKPVIASVKGHALGAGCDIMLSCDFRVIAENANMGLVFVQRALTAGILTLIYHVGLAKATELLFTGRNFNASEAQQMGLANVVCPDEKLEEETYKFADRFVEMATSSIGIIKEGINKIIDVRSKAEEQANMFCLNSLTEDTKEGGRAFIEKRKPVFKGY